MEPCFQTFSLQCQPEELVGLSSRYAYQNGTDDRILEEISPRVQKLGYIPYDDFLLICEWKTQRSKSRVRKNSAAMVEEASAFALVILSFSYPSQYRQSIPSFLSIIKWLNFAHATNFCLNCRG